MSQPSLLIAAAAASSPGDSAAAAAPTGVQISDSAPYAIQLCSSAAPIDPRSVPILDIFELYTLYCDVRLENGVTRHALRLGFFKETTTAKVIARYLACYFETPQIVHLNTTDQTRSLRVKLVALKDIGDSGRHTVIELSGPEPLRRSPQPQTRHAAPRAAPPPRAHDGNGRSLWSRLLEPLQQR
jgi:hypothetical protein